MITAFIAALLILALGVAAKGAIAHGLVIFGAWMTKNVLMLGFLRTPTGKRTVSAVKRGAQRHLVGDKPRIGYRMSNRLPQLRHSLAKR